MTSEGKTEGSRPRARGPELARLSGAADAPGIAGIEAEQLARAAALVRRRALLGSMRRGPAPAAPREGIAADGKPRAYSAIVRPGTAS
jgi:hypothetical protein